QIDVATVRVDARAECGKVEPLVCSVGWWGGIVGEEIDVGGVLSHRTGWNKEPRHPHFGIFNPTPHAQQPLGVPGAGIEVQEGAIEVVVIKELIGARKVKA